MSHKKNVIKSKNGRPGAVAVNRLIHGLNPLNSLHSNNVQGSFIRAKLKFDRGDLQGALLDMNEYLKMYPLKINALIFRAVILSYLFEYADAIRDLTKAVMMNPGYLVARLIRGDIYRSMGDAVASIADFDAVIQSSPGEAMAYIGRADSKMLLHDSDGAMNDYARALELNPGLITLCPDMVMTCPP